MSWSDDIKRAFEENIDNLEDALYESCQDIQGFVIGDQLIPIATGAMGGSFQVDRPHRIPDFLVCDFAYTMEYAVKQHDESLYHAASQPMPPGATFQAFAGFGGVGDQSSQYWAGYWIARKTGAAKKYKSEFLKKSLLIHEIQILENIAYKLRQKSGN